MIMNLNDLLTKQNVLTKLVLASGEKELPKELKVKVMRIRMSYNKIKKKFDEESQEFAKDIVSDELQELSQKTERTTEESNRFNELNNKANSEYMEFIQQKGLEEIKEEFNDSFTESEYSDIVDVNSSNDVEINGNKIKAADFLEIFYDLFITEHEN